MDFRSRQRRDLLALLLSISATTCSAPKDDTADATTDPSNVVAADPPTAAADDMSASPVLRLAPVECPPDRLTGEADLWTEPDSVLLGTGLLLELQGCESVGGWKTYSYDGPAPVTPYHVVEIHYYEGFSWLLVNADARRWQAVRSRPVFSPDGAWFATAWSDLEAGYNPSHLDIWAVEADSVRRVLALTGGMEWGAVDPRWVSSNRVEYLRVTWTSGMPHDSVATGVTRHDAEWVPDPPTQLSFSFQYHDSTEVDLTGDGVPETLRLTASGPRPLGLAVSFSIRSDGREIYQMSWGSGGYFKYEPELVMSEPGDSVLYAHVRDQLGPFFDESAFMTVPRSALNADYSRGPFDPPDMDNDPVKLISGQLLMPFLQDSLSAAGVDSTAVFRQAIEIAYWSGRVHPEAQGIWDLMTAEELLTFRFNAGGEANQRIAWSRISGRFFNVWACC